MPEGSPLIQTAARIGRRVANESRAAFYARRTGVLGGDPPRRAAAVLRASARYGQLAAAVKIAALRQADRRRAGDAVADHLGAGSAAGPLRHQLEELITHAAVEEAAVIGVDDDEFGKRLAAFVVLAPGMALSDDELREFVKGNLARYKVPRDVQFLDELPRNPTGKVLKRRLRKIHAAGV